MEQRPKKLLDQARDAIRLKHYSPHTEHAYVTWIKRYIFFHSKRHSKDMGSADIEAFLTYLAAQQKVAASTQNQASASCCSSSATCSGTRSTCPSTPSVPKAQTLAHSADKRGCAEGDRVRLRKVTHDESIRPGPPDQLAHVERFHGIRLESAGDGQW